MTAPEVVPLEVAGAKIGYLVRRRVLELVGDALGRAGLDALLVKGAGLAETVYPTPWARTMSDIDLVVPPSKLDATLRALAAAGGDVVPVPIARKHSYDALGERAVRFSLGAVAWLVEVHATLDKVVAHPIDWDGIRGRAEVVAGLPEALRVPCHEDHALLVILHAALSELQHPLALEDLRHLFAAGIDRDRFVERALAWRLAPAARLVLACSLEVAHDPQQESALRALRVPGWRVALAQRLFRDPRGASPSRGWQWALKQGALRDDPGAWLRGLVRFAGKRALDRLAW